MTTLAIIIGLGLVCACAWLWLDESRDRVARDLRRTFPKWRNKK